MSNLYNETYDAFIACLEANRAELQLAIWQACGEPPVAPESIGLIAESFSTAYMAFLKTKPNREAREAFMAETPYEPNFYVCWVGDVPAQAPVSLMHPVNGVETRIDLDHVPHAYKESWAELT